MLFLHAAAAATLVVDAENSEGTTHTDLTAALAELNDGDTLYIRAGEYPIDQVYVSGADIQVIGESAETVRLVAPEDLSHDFTALKLYGMDGWVSISGVTFEGPPLSEAVLTYSEGTEEHGARVESCRFLGAAYGLAVLKGRAEVSHSAFIGNDYGIVYASYESLVVHDSLFVGNRRGIGPTGAVLSRGEASYRHNTFVDNTEFDLGDNGSGSLEVLDNVFVGDKVNFHFAVGSYTTSVYTMSHNLFFPWIGEGFEDERPRGDHAIEADPLFANRDPDAESWEIEDFRLLPCSPAADAASEEVLDQDLTGRTRPLDGNCDGEARSDLGALETVACEEGVELDCSTADTAGSGEDSDDSPPSPGDSATSDTAADSSGDSSGDDAAKGGREEAEQDEGCGCGATPSWALGGVLMALVGGLVAGRRRT